MRLISAYWSNGKTATTLLPTLSTRTRSLLIVAGLDPSGGAGLLADADVARSNRLHAAGVATVLTVQNSRGCMRTVPVDPQIISDQLSRLLEDLHIVAVKIGALGNAEIARAVTEKLARRSLPLVVDPVLQSSAGAKLYSGDLAALWPLWQSATLVTPNCEELSTIAGCSANTEQELTAAAQKLRARGIKSVLAKGGHLPGDPVDILIDATGLVRFPSPRAAATPHGTGCALSTAIACQLGLGVALRQAVARAHADLQQRIASTRTVGGGRLFLG